MAVISNWVVHEHIREKMIIFEEEERRISAEDGVYIYGWLLGVHVANVRMGNQ
jgi:hypothetical protein